MRAILAMTVLGLALAPLAGCATARKKKPPTRDPVDIVLEAAAGLMGSTKVVVDGRAFRSDCSGFVTGAYHAIRRDLIDPGVGGRSGTELLYRSFRSQGRIQSGKKLRRGDLLFFHNTWDRNRNGLRDDRFTHVGLVERVEADGRAWFLHFASGRVKRAVINLRHPAVSHDPDTGLEWNTPVRRGRGKTLTGQLFFRSARPL